MIFHDQAVYTPFGIGLGVSNCPRIDGFDWLSVVLGRSWQWQQMDHTDHDAAFATEQGIEGVIAGADYGRRGHDLDQHSF